MPNNFDPISFLNLTKLPTERQDELGPKIYQHMAYYLLARFLEELPEDKYLEVEVKAKTVKNPDEVFCLVNQYDPEFESKKLKWLEEYRERFDISLLDK